MNSAREHNKPDSERSPIIYLINGYMHETSLFKQKEDELINCWVTVIGDCQSLTSNVKWMKNECQSLMFLTTWTDIDL